MARLNVRCCCQPQKILGTLELTHLRPGPQHLCARMEYPRLADLVEYIGDGKGILPSIPYEQIELRYCRDPNQSKLEIAVYSDDRPIEFWRKFSSFREATSPPEPAHLVDNQD